MGHMQVRRHFCMDWKLFSIIHIFTSVYLWHDMLWESCTWNFLMERIASSFHAYIDLSILIQGDVKIFNLQSHSFQLGPGEVLKWRMHVVPDHSELDWALFSACCSQCVTTAPLKVISHSVKGDVVWITVHAAGGRFEREAVLDPLLDLTNLIVCTLHCGAPQIIITHTLALLHTLSFHECCSFLQGKGRCVNKL